MPKIQVIRDKKGYDIEIDGSSNRLRNVELDNLKRRFKGMYWVENLYHRIQHMASDSLKFDTSEVPMKEVKYYIRGIRETRNTREQFNIFPVGVDLNLDEPVIEWDHDQCICLDIDGHPVCDWNVTSTVRPAYSWKSHGGGYHLIFMTDDKWTAEDRAAAAAYEVLMKEPYLRVEFKKCTRHPLGERNGQKCGKVQPHKQSSDLTAVQGLLFADPDPSVLAPMGWLVGDRYDHAKCPFDPSPNGQRDPVVAYPDGIKCYYCNNQFISWGELVHGKKFTAIHNMVKHTVHWGQAKHFFNEHYRHINHQIMESIYRVLLRITHGDSGKVQRVFYDRDNLVLWESGWGDLVGKAFGSLKSALLLKTLPVSRDSKDILIPGEPELLSGSVHTCKSKGYIPLRKMPGARIFHHFNQGGDGYIPVFLYPGLPEDRHPRYIPSNQRMPKEAAWAVLEKPFPGLNRSLIELLIIAKGINESRQGIQNFIFITGPSSAGKTVSAKIAAAMMGERVSECTWSENTERVRQSILESNDSGSICVFNEMIKTGKASRKTPCDTADFLLNLTAESTSWKIYEGPVPLGHVPVIVITDTSVPWEIRNDTQLGRRIIHVHLTKSIEMVSSINNTIGQVKNLRTSDKEYCTASDSIISHIIDEHFMFLEERPRINFFEKAKSLGYETIREINAAERRPLLIEFFKRYNEAGADWVSVETPQMHDLWNDLGGERQITAEDWGSIVGIPGRFILKVKGGLNVVKFEKL